MAVEHTGPVFGGDGGGIILEDDGGAGLAVVNDSATGAICIVDPTDAKVKKLDHSCLTVGLPTDLIQGGAYEVDGDKLDIDFTPVNYAPTTAPPEVTDVNHLTAHLAGIDTALAGVGADDKRVKISAADTTAGFLSEKLIAGAGDDGVGFSFSILTPAGDEDYAIALNGDKVSIDWSPSNYTRDAGIGEADDVKDLAAHLKGIDTALGGKPDRVTFTNGNIAEWDASGNLIDSGIAIADLPDEFDESVTVHNGEHSTGSLSYKTVGIVIIDCARFPATTGSFHWDQVTAPGAGASVRLQNITDALTIGSLTGITTTGLKSFSLTLPTTGVKRFELQQKKDSGAGTTRIAGGLIVSV